MAKTNLVRDNGLKTSTHFQYFQSNLDSVDLPARFKYPLHYTPDTIAIIAAEELQQYLKTQTDWEHDFGMLHPNEGEIIGKMFGVLVVKNLQGELGYLCAVSGKLAGQNLHQKFVPPVFDILPEDGFFRKGEALITEINQRIDELEQNADFLNTKNNLLESKKLAESEIDACKLRNQKNKELRHLKRKHADENSQEDLQKETLLALNHQSKQDHYILKSLRKDWQVRLSLLENELSKWQEEIDELKVKRKSQSAALQQTIFDHFNFVDKDLNKRSVGDIFKHHKDGNPIAGSGECAAPKLFQYAFLSQLQPIALAEFWWGQSPKTEVRIHGHYYPACRGKCEPILNHMLQGMDIEENPLLKNPAEGKEIEIIWEDSYIVIINKPHEFLSVPGKQIEDSVQTRLKARYPEATGPLLVHRLDMSTSGLLIAAKTEEVYKAIQSQFLRREVQKRYAALLDGIVAADEGLIDLPMRVDLDNRPRQMVCYAYGKPAQTRWKVIERKNGRTLIHFFPLTGRTHQLRVHAAHALGLNHPIVGDDLYGKLSTRLHLHAEFVQFRHPVTHRNLSFHVPAGF
jgi:tRNA pseudouridine32 synthase / 23S rRNA pseudouridine746 synthase